MFDLRLKQAQVAMSDGRLDECFELLQDSSLRSHRSGQKLLLRLARTLVQRGRQHLVAQRPAAAMEDCLRAEKLAGNLPETAQLRSDICDRIEADRIEAQEKAEQLDKARRQIQNGWLSTGRRLLAEAEDRQARCLMKDAEHLAIEQESAVNRIDQALKNDQIELAARIYQSSRLGKHIDQTAGSVFDRIVQQAHRKVLDYLHEGQIHLAASFLNQLSGSISRSDRLQPYHQVIEYSRRAIGQIDAGHFEAAVVNLRKIQTLLPKAKWITEVIRQNELAAKARQELQSGPLGILENIALSGLSDSASTHPEFRPLVSEKNQAPLIRPHKGMDMKMRFILQIDGIGAYYVFCDDRVTMGPVSSSVRSDIEVVTAPDVQSKQIERIEGDYFLTDAHRGPQINNPDRQLLHDGDRVALSSRCRFKFILPNPASSTACLVPASARFPRADINGAILMHREILIGPGRNCHIQTGQVTETITLFIQDDQLRCRTDQTVTVDGQDYRSLQMLPMNKQIEIGDIQLILTTNEE